MKMKRIALLAAAAVGLTAGSAFAIIDGSHHDAMAVDPVNAASVCFYCHGIKYTTAFTPVGTYGNVGNFCLIRCHQPAGILNGAVVGPLQVNDAGAEVQTNNQGALSFTASHPRTKGNLAGLGDDPATGMDVTTWPYSLATSMECTTCHAVHDNDAGTPFLYTTLSAGTYCERCHNGHGGGNDMSATGPMGSHPEEVLWAGPVDHSAGNVARSLPRRARQLGMDLSPTTAAPLFDVASTCNSAATCDPIANKYTTGGHLSTFATVTAAGRVGCYTCHSAHADVNNDLLIVSRENTALSGNLICAGCHGGNGAANTAASPQNAGGTAYYHPANTESGYDAGGPGATWYKTSTSPGFYFQVDATQFPLLSRNQFGANGAVLCTTCHDVHNGKAGFMALANVGFGGAGQPAQICGVCHTAGGLNQENAHHITGPVASGENWAGYEPSWAATKGVTVSDGLDCTDCHIVNDDAGRKSAHNW